MHGEARGVEGGCLGTCRVGFKVFGAALGYAGLWLAVSGHGALGELGKEPEVLGLVFEVIMVVVDVVGGGGLRSRRDEVFVGVCHGRAGGGVCTPTGKLIESVSAGGRKDLNVSYFPMATTRGKLPLSHVDSGVDHGK